jgi:hypothetical protein
VVAGVRIGVNLTARAGQAGTLDPYEQCNVWTGGNRCFGKTDHIERVVPELKVGIAGQSIQRVW